MKILDVVGNTPMVEIQNGSGRPGIRLYAKLEGTNPAGSVKDRPARSMILRAEARGDLKPGMKLIEPTSGNTGIALAMIASARGYAIELVMPETATVERMHVMRAYGAEVILKADIEACIDYAHAQVAKGGYVMLDQFANPDNWRAHYETTGPEIWRDSAGDVTHFVSAMGTTGTIMGVSRFLKEKNERITIVGCQPTDGSSIPGIRRWPEAYLPKIFERPRVDRIVDIDQTEAEATARQLAKTEGLFSGPSSGGAVWAARKIAGECAAVGQDATIVCIICDRGDRYVSLPLFSGTS